MFGRLRVQPANPDNKGIKCRCCPIIMPEVVAKLTFMELAMILPELLGTVEVLVTGKASMVYLCHPFLVHGAQLHHVTEPEFTAQPTLLLISDLIFEGSGPFCPVEEAIRALLIYN